VITSEQEYVAAVLSHLPRCLIDRSRVEADLRAHVAERMSAAGELEVEAVQHLGPPEEVAAELLTGVQLQPASFRRRLAAFAIDLVIGMLPTALLLILVMPFFPADLMDLVQANPLGLVFGAFILGALSVPALSVFYFPVLEKLFGQTLGKWLMGIIVVRENGAALRWKDAILRRVSFLFEFFWLDALFALFTKERQRAFDRVAGTVVVRCPIAGGLDYAEGIAR